MAASDITLKGVSTHAANTAIGASDRADIIATNNAPLYAVSTHAADGLFGCVCASDHLAGVGAFFDDTAIIIPTHTADIAVGISDGDCALVGTTDDGSYFIPSAHTANIGAGTEVGICNSNVFDGVV